ncbi:uncharacterized protein KD926_007039 [Aspergillus affinis]|uniref:uncharacterized protein n=1 Tax=Aspergillus affinis TaxID=1070780 RepID=UPI0022FE9958|nr:uncharacterized protein KD926_007039 [Aspergillus affinis]KAI9045738.1 hypothetical protein KD926_007039 [Aspergillus affinis]
MLPTKSTPKIPPLIPARIHFHLPLHPRWNSTTSHSSSSKSTMSVHSSPRLRRFQQAQESIYGDFNSISDPRHWSPPPNLGGHRGRYLWTDAFGVINFLTLHRETALQQTSPVPNDRYLILACRLVETVHEILGRTRDGLNRLPGATDTNPLGGGLRIGKPDATGPDAEGQYHHYLTVWMFALNRLSLATGDPIYNRQAVALAQVIHPRFFVGRESARPRMVWKMAVDLSAPMVVSEGNLDPVDGYVVFRLLQAAAKQAGEGIVLADEIVDYRRIMRRRGEHYVSEDPLDLGMTMWTVHWFVEKEEWATRLAGQADERVDDLFEVERYFERSIKSRLAFREFGTCLGLQCISEQLSEKEGAVDLKAHADSILDFWEPYMEQSLGTPEDLRPITKVMYASALLPGAFRHGYLGPEPVPNRET